MPTPTCKYWLPGVNVRTADNDVVAGDEHPAFSLLSVSIRLAPGRFPSSAESRRVRQREEQDLFMRGQTLKMLSLHTSRRITII